MLGHRSNDSVVGNDDLTGFLRQSFNLFSDDNGHKDRGLRGLIDIGAIVLVARGLDIDLVNYIFRKHAGGNDDQVSVILDLR